MEEDYSEEVEVKTAGCSETLFFDPERSSCGDIDDGVSFRFAGHGVWVIPYRELWRLTALARESRRRWSEPIE